MATVLLTDGQQRKTLAATRSLGRQGHRVLVADETLFSTTRFSRYCQRGLLSPPPARTDAYLAWLLALRERHAPDVLLPMDDLTTALAVAHRRHLPYKTLLPEPDQFDPFRDKAGTAALAERAGVPHPMTRAVETESEALSALRQAGSTLVLKARRSSGGRGIAFVDSPDQLRAAWRKARPDWGGFLLQERIPLGPKYDVCLLFGPTGDLRASFVQRELRWFPLEQGASTLQESVVRPDLVELALRLLAPLGWRGPVEVEFMEDPAGRPVLMEVNPRFWASVELAIRCGVDFPGLTAALAAGEQVRGPDSYPAGIRCRWLLPGDLLHFAVNPDRFRMEPGFCATYDHRTFDDILSLEDPLPVLGFAFAVLRYSWDPTMWRFLMRW